MIIDRHNYEEYFILYMDNELSSEERRMVEAFVQQHPDLKEELDILSQYKFTPDNEVSFPGKEELMKVNGDTPITMSNYEEWLVLYLDDELTPVQRNSVESFLNSNPVAQKELLLLSDTKLQPEQIIFADKDSLYRKEERARIFPWWRMAVAAILLLAIGITAVLVFNKKNESGSKGVAKSIPGVEKQNNPANNNLTSAKEEKIAVPSIANENKDAVANNSVQSSVNPTIKQDNKAIAVKDNNKILPNKNVLSNNSQEPLKKQQEVIVTNNDKPSNNLPVPLNNTPVQLNNPNLNKNDASNNNKDAAVTNSKIENSNPSKNPLTTHDVTNVMPASYNNSNGAADQLEEGGNNKKSRGLFRKLIRTFEKRTNIGASDDDKILIGGLAIKLK